MGFTLKKVPSETILTVNIQDTTWVKPQLRHNTHSFVS